VWIAASTHEGEELKVLDAHRALLETHAGLLLVLVPRHPERFDSVRELVKEQAFNVVSRTETQPCVPSTEVFLVDTMGEVPLFYAASDIAFVGGSLVPVGGHNLLEFIELGACRVVADGSELATAVANLLDNPAAAREMGSNGLAFLEQNRGSLQRLLVLLEPLLASDIETPQEGS